jgi:hypothetical protein
MQTRLDGTFSNLPEDLTPFLSVPVEYYKIPPGHMKKKGPPSWAGKGHGPHQKKPKDK